MGEIEVIQTTSSEWNETPPLLFVHGANHAAWCWKEYFLPFFPSSWFPVLCHELSGTWPK